MKQVQSIEIVTSRGLRKIGPGNACFIVAELSGNHNQDINRAHQIIDAAADAGADAVKLQTYTADTLTIDCDNKYFQVNVNDEWKGQTLYQLYQKAYTPWEWHEELKQHADKRGLVFFSTPFDSTAVDFLETLNVPIYKVASFEAADVELLQRIAQTKKPVIMSRGLQSAEDIEMAINVLRTNGCPSVIVLHCISAYPAMVEDMNIRTVEDIRERFGVVSGLSDHSVGITAAVSAVALGASVIEKHVTLARAEGGVDSAFSLEPNELRDLVATIRDVEKALGKVTYDLGTREKENLVFKRSIFAVKDIVAGDILSRDNIKIIRPGYGLAPKHLGDVLGCTAKVNINRGTPISWDCIINKN